MTIGKGFRNPELEFQLWNNTKHYDYRYVCDVLKKYGFVPIPNLDFMKSRLKCGYSTKFRQMNPDSREVWFSLDWFVEWSTPHLNYPKVYFDDEKRVGEDVLIEISELTGISMNELTGTPELDYASLEGFIS
jgi:hypothetical protein